MDKTDNRRNGNRSNSKSGGIRRASSQDERRAGSKTFNNRVPQPCPTSSLEQRRQREIINGTSRSGQARRDPPSAGHQHPWVPVWSLPLPPPPPPSYTHGRKYGSCYLGDEDQWYWPPRCRSRVPPPLFGYRPAEIPWDRPPGFDFRRPSAFHRSVDYYHYLPSQLVCPKHGPWRWLPHREQPRLTKEEFPSTDEKVGDERKSSPKSPPRGDDIKPVSTSPTDLHTSNHQRGFPAYPSCRSVLEVNQGSEEDESRIRRSTSPSPPLSRETPLHSTPANFSLQQIHWFFQMLEQEEIIEMLKECDKRHERQMDFNRSLMEEKSSGERSLVTAVDNETALDSSDSDTEIVLYWNLKDTVYDLDQIYEDDYEYNPESPFPSPYDISHLKLFDNQRDETFDLAHYF